jgi:hypothetical protein
VVVGSLQNMPAVMDGIKKILGCFSQFYSIYEKPPIRKADVKALLKLKLSVSNRVIAYF